MRTPAALLFALVILPLAALVSCVAITNAALGQQVEIAAGLDLAQRIEAQLLANAAPGLSAECLTRADQTGAASNLDAEQLGYAVLIISETEARPLPQRAAVIAVATALQESSLRNLDHGDLAGPDSRGLFQQRLRYYENPTDPVWAIGAFLDRLVQVERWATRPLTEAAQAVQISAHPDYYAKWEPLASDLVATYWGAECEDTATVPIVAGRYATPVDLRWYDLHPHWFVKTHHTYPAADLPLPYGEPVYAVTYGTVRYSGGNCGLGVSIDATDGYTYTNCHFSSRDVAPGETVVPGQVIGRIGSTGNSSGPHLHFAIWVDGGQVCPQRLLVAWSIGQHIDPAGLPKAGCTH